MASFEEIARKKVAGVPVLYLAGAAVIILVVVAIKMKPSPDAAGTEETAGKNGGGMAPQDDPYANFNPDGSGTVTVVQSPKETEPTAPYTNDQWVKDGIVWLIANPTKVGPISWPINGTTVQGALTKYIQGQDLAYEEGQMVNAWIAQKGPPPDGAGSAVKIGPKPLEKQFATPPGDHRVTTPGYDDSYGKVAMLYYGTNDQTHYDLIQGANPQLGLTPNAFAPGTVVHVPKNEAPAYYTLPNDMSRSQICGKNGISEYTFQALNNTSNTQFKKGAKVRVR